jgi:hypothetical protein
MAAADAKGGKPQGMIVSQYFSHQGQNITGRIFQYSAASFMPSLDILDSGLKPQC